MISLKNIRTMLFLSIMGVIVLFIRFILREKTAISHLKNIERKPVTILWWSSMPENYQNVRYCSTYKCRFSGKRLDFPEAEAFLFYGSDFKVDDLPLPRSPHHIWALLHEESPRNVPFVPYNSFLKHFNFTSTFSRYSDYPLTTYYLADARDLTSPSFMVPIGEKTLLRKNQNLAPIVFIQSDCDTMSGRDDYVKELMKYVDIDSYGKCLNNRQLPASLRTDYLNNLYSDELYHFLARYKFVLSYENGVCHDYITEKFWRPLVIGSIPIYFGSPTIKDWEPNKKSVIHIDEFSSPKALAKFIKDLDNNDIEYNTYLNHKYNQLKPISNKRLIEELEFRETSAIDTNLFAAFECYICRQLHETIREQNQVATLSHYNCSLPLLYPPSIERSMVKNGEDWSSVLAVGRCQSETLNELLMKNSNFTKHEFDELLMKRIQLNECNP